MKKLMIAFVASAFVLSFTWNTTFAVQAGGGNEDEANIPNPLVIGGEGIAALGLGATLGCGTLVATLGGLAMILQPEDMNDPRFGLMVLGGIAAGYGLGFPLGSAAGAIFVGEITYQRGSFWWSWAGAELGALAAVGVFLSDDGGIARPGTLACSALIFGPPMGAVIGYNLSRPKGTQTTKASLDDPSDPDGPQLSLLLPEVELRQDRISDGIRQPVKGSPTLTYKLTLAKLTF